MRKNSLKNTRINGEVLRTLAEILRGGIKDPRVSPLTSVVSVEVSPDLKTCKAWISVLGGEEEQKSTLEGLRSASGYIKSRLAKEINLRNTPELTFIMDQSIAYGVKMSRLIDEVNLYGNPDGPDRNGGQDGADAGADGADKETGGGECE